MPRKLLIALICGVLTLAGCQRTTEKISAGAPPATEGQAKQKKRAPARPADAPLTAEQKQLNLESFDYVWARVRDTHYDPKLNGADWDAARAELRPKVESAKTMAEARAPMSELLSRLNQTHFGIIPKSHYEDIPGADGPRKVEVVSGIDARATADGSALVTAVEAGSGAAGAGVKPGWIIHAVRGLPVAPILEKVAEAHEGSTLIAGMQAITLDAILHGEGGNTVDVEFIDGDNKKRRIDVPLKPPSGEVVKFGHLERPVKFVAKKIEPNVGYIAFNIFLGANLVPQFKEAVESFMDTDGLIIDLRGNPGGVGFMAVGMGNLLVDRDDQKLGTMTTRDFNLNFILTQQATTYDKPVAVLIDGASMSTSEIMAQGLRDIGRARLFGTPTAGAALPSLIEQLPNGDRFQYATANYVSYGGDVLEGRGVEPDELAPPDRKALLAGHDAAVDAAMKWIASQKK